MHEWLLGGIVGHIVWGNVVEVKRTCRNGNVLDRGQYSLVEEKNSLVGVVRVSNLQGLSTP